MNHQYQVDIIQRIFERIAGGTSEMAPRSQSIPTARYTSRAHQEMEYRQLFDSRPMLITASCRLSEPGAYLTDDLSGHPIIVVRNEAGDVNAFLNVCRHRGARVAQGCGVNDGTFVCPYHGWRYGNDGRLRELFPRAAFADVDRETRHLVRLPVVESHGFIWVLPVNGGHIRPTHLGAELGPELDSYGFGTFAHFETQRLHKRMNWKLVIDTFLENWHFGKLHRETLGDIFLPGIGIVDTFGDNVRVVYPRKSILELKHQPQSHWDLLRHSIIVYVLAPNVLINWQGTHLEVWRAFPVRGEPPDQCWVEASLYSPAPAIDARLARHWRKNMALLMQVVDGEDFPVAESIQAGFASNAQNSILFGRNEPALIQFHENLQRMMQGPSHGAAEPDRSVMLASAG